MENFANATPAEIDTELAELMWQQSKHLGQAGGIKNSLKGYIKRGQAQPEHLLKALIQEEESLAQIAEAIAPFTEEFNRRGGWTRFFMVSNNGGHLHKNMLCSTCRPTTAFGWMPEFSGQDEAGVVNMAGEDACTVCFPTAPVHQRSMLPFRVAEREVAEKLAAEKEAKRAAAAAQLVTVGPRDFFKTVRGAENEVGHQIEWMIHSRLNEAASADHQAQLDRNAAGYLARAKEIVEAIKVTVPGYDGEALLAKKFATKVKEFHKYGREIPENFTL